MANNKFVPDKLTIKVGETVRWINDAGTHTVTRRDSPESFDSGTLIKGQSFEHTFTQPSPAAGFRYICVPHVDKGMIGTIIVEAHQPYGHKFKSYVDPGSEDDAIAYYKRIAGELKLPDPGPIGMNLQQMLTYLGYSQREAGVTKGLTAEDLERLRSDVLMSFDLLKAEVLNVEEFRLFFGTPKPDDAVRTIHSTRFFAPKITDVSGSTNPPQFGWRKLVRLKARLGSHADIAGVDAAFVLFNFLQGDLKRDPFEGRSAQNQVILVRKAKSTLPDPLYWFVYDSLPEAKLGLFLTATFDFRDPAIVPQGRYFVPNACADCHGGPGKVDGVTNILRFPTAKLNFLDTDHWHDRVQSCDDFAAVGRSDHGVVFDGGKTPGNLMFEGAFDVVRNLNAEILAQNLSVDQAGASFQVRAAKTWLGLHQKNSAFLPPLDRPISVGTKVVWDKKNPTDMELLPLLNRFCYRCHSSVRYHVFDKEMVLDYRDLMIAYINEPSIVNRMPQDRLLNDEYYPGVKQRMTDLLKALK